MLIFVIRENEIVIFVIRYPLIFLFRERVRDPLYDPLQMDVIEQHLMCYCSCAV